MTRLSLLSLCMPVVVTLGVTPAADAAARISEPVQADQAWARATPPQQHVSSGYVTLTSPNDDRLVSVTSAVAGQVVLHEMTMDGPIMRMRAPPVGIRLPQGISVGLTPGGYHLMISGLSKPLLPGQSIPMTLHFQHAPPLDVQFQVLPLSASGPAPTNPAMPPMPGMRNQ